MSTDASEETLNASELERETRRLTERYVAEFVLPLGLCPWAAPALEGGHVQVSVITEVFSDAQFSLVATRLAAALRAVSSTTDLVLLVMPRLRCTRLAMDELLRVLRKELQQRAPDDPAQKRQSSEFALASFHPDAAPDEATPERFIPFLRRSPDPLVQAVRTSALPRVETRGGTGTTFLDLERLGLGDLHQPPVESLRLRIARSNLEAVRALGLKRAQGILDSIHEDRRRTHRRLGLSSDEAKDSPERA